MNGLSKGEYRSRRSQAKVECQEFVGFYLSKSGHSEAPHSHGEVSAPFTLRKENIPDM